MKAVTDLGPGYWVMTPLVTDRGFTVLINRGFVPSERQKPADRADGQVEGPTTVTGLLRLTEPDGGFLRANDPAGDRWFSRDVPAIAHSQGLTAAAPFFVDAGMPDASAQVVGEAKRSTAADLQNQVWPRSGLTQIRFTNNHLVYALTWYGLALMVLGAAWLVVRHQRRKA